MGYIPLDMIGMEDIGICAKNVFTDPHRWLGKTVSLSGDKMTVKVSYVSGNSPLPRCETLKLQECKMSRSFHCKVGTQRSYLIIAHFLQEYAQIMTDEAYPVVIKVDEVRKIAANAFKALICFEFVIAAFVCLFVLGFFIQHFAFSATLEVLLD